MIKKIILFSVLLCSFTVHAKEKRMQCRLDGDEIRRKEIDAGSINIETVDGLFKGSKDGNVGQKGYIQCINANASPGPHGRNIRIESYKNEFNICFKGNTTINERNKLWDNTVGRVFPVFQTERAQKKYEHFKTTYTLTACDPGKKIPSGTHVVNLMALSWQRLLEVRGIMFYRLQVNVKDSVEKVTCKISNKGDAQMKYGRLPTSNTYRKHYDAKIECNKPTSFSYKLHNATPQVSGIPSIISDKTYLGVGLGVVNGTVWVSTVDNTPLTLSGKRRSEENPYLRINSEINVAPGNIKDTGGEMNGSVILQILTD